MPQPATYRGMALVVPDNDSEGNGSFAPARQHKLMVRACTACGLMRYPPTHACPWCMDLGWRWQELSGKGTIHSYEVVHHAIQPGFKDSTPYTIVLPSAWAWAVAARTNSLEITVAVGIPWSSKNTPSCTLHVVQDPQSARPSTSTSVAPT